MERFSPVHAAMNRVIPDHSIHSSAQPNDSIQQATHDRQKTKVISCTILLLDESELTVEVDVSGHLDLELKLEQFLTKISCVYRKIPQGKNFTRRFSEVWTSRKPIIFPASLGIQTGPRYWKRSFGLSINLLRICLTNHFKMHFINFKSTQTWISYNKKLTKQVESE